MERSHWKTAFSLVGVDETRLKEMTDEEFVETCDLISSIDQIQIPKLEDKYDEEFQQAYMQRIRENKQKTEARGVDTSNSPSNSSSTSSSDILGNEIIATPPPQPDIQVENPPRPIIRPVEFFYRKPQDYDSYRQPVEISDEIIAARNENRDLINDPKLWMYENPPFTTWNLRLKRPTYRRSLFLNERSQEDDYGYFGFIGPRRGIGRGPLPFPEQIPRFTELEGMANPDILHGLSEAPALQHVNDARYYTIAARNYMFLNPPPRAFDSSSEYSDSDDDDLDKYEYDDNDTPLERKEKSEKKKEIERKKMNPYYKIIKREERKKRRRLRDNASRPPPRRNESSEIIKQQDKEFIDALKQAQDIEKKEIEESNPVEDPKIRIREEKQRLLRLSQEIPPEPAAGLSLLFVFPTGKRVPRKFSKESPGEDVYLFIGGHDCMFHEDETPLKFSLQIVGQGELQRDKTLEEQNVKNRTLINIAEE